jgi:lysophospholipase L1-like esterase
MKVYLNSEGAILQTVPSVIPRGSTVTDFEVEAPFSAAIMAVRFTLRTGTTEPMILPMVSSVSAPGLNLWSAKLDAAVTEFSGSVPYSIEVQDASGYLIRTVKGSLTISPGQTPTVPSAPPQDVWTAIRDYLNQILSYAKEAAIESSEAQEWIAGFEAARGITVSESGKSVLYKLIESGTLSELVRMLEAYQNGEIKTDTSEIEQDISDLQRWVEIFESAKGLPVTEENGAIRIYKLIQSGDLNALLEMLGAYQRGEIGSGDATSPTAKVEQTSDGARITITDKDGTTIANVTNGKDGTDGKDGADGKDGINGKDGAQGPQGPQGPAGTDGPAGADGAPGERGNGILNITTSPSSYTTATGGFTPVYRIALSNVLSQSKVSKVLVGDTLAYNYYQYPVGYVDSSYVYLGTRKSIRGETGGTGAAGAAGKSAYAYAKEGGFDGTEEEFAEKLATEYLEKDEMFYISTTVTPDYTNQIPFSTDTDGSVFNGIGYIADKTLRSDGSLGDNAGTFVSGFIPVKKGDIIRVKDTSQPGFESSLTFCLYSASQATATGIGKSAGYLNTVYGSSTIEGNVLTWDTSGIGYYPWTNFAYLRVTTFSANAVVTVNEELIESEKDELTLKPEVKVPVDNLSGELISTPLAGETVVCFGDSLFGMYRDDSSTPAQIASKTGATVYNVGFGGCRMSVHPTSGYAEFSMWALAKAISENNWSAQDAAASKGSDYFPDQLKILKGIDFSAVDSIVIHYGTNDFAAGVAVDNASDPDDYATLCGALRYSIEKLLGVYPKLKIFVSLPVFRYWTASDGTVTYSDTYLANGKTLPVFVEALRSVALEYNLPVIDGYYGMGINKDNASAFLSDGTHHNADGRKRFGEFIGAHLTSFGQTAPVKGIDYLSPTVKAEIVNDVLAALPTAEGVEF